MIEFYVNIKNDIVQPKIRVLNLNEANLEDIKYELAMRDNIKQVWLILNNFNGLRKIVFIYFKAKKKSRKSGSVITNKRLIFRSKDL